MSMLDEWCGPHCVYEYGRVRHCRCRDCADAHTPPAPFEDVVADVRADLEARARAITEHARGPLRSHP